MDDTPTMGMRALNSLRLGLAPGQQGVDVRAAAKAIQYIPLPNGLLMDKGNGDIVGTSLFTEQMIDTLFQYPDLLRNNPDFQYAEVLAAKRNKNAFQMIQDTTLSHLARIDAQVKQVLKEHVARRNISVEERARHVSRLYATIHEYHAISDRFDALKATFELTVDRWYWLATVTGTGFDPKKMMPHVPYWLMTEYVFKQYVTTGDPDIEMDITHEETYWDLKNAGDAASILRALLPLVNRVTIHNESKLNARRIYLMLRDFVFGSRLTLQGGVVYNGAPASVDSIISKINEQCELRSIQTASSLRGEGIATITNAPTPNIAKPVIDSGIGLTFKTTFNNQALIKKEMPADETRLFIRLFKWFNENSQIPESTTLIWLDKAKASTWVKDHGGGASFKNLPDPFKQMVYILEKGFSQPGDKWISELPSYFELFFASTPSHSDTKIEDEWKKTGAKIMTTLNEIRTHKILPMLFTTELIRSTFVGPYTWTPFPQYASENSGAIESKKEPDIEPLPGKLSLNDDAFADVSWELLYRNYLRNATPSFALSSRGMQKFNDAMTADPDSHPMLLLWNELANLNAANIGRIGSVGVPETKNLVPYLGTRTPNPPDALIMSLTALAERTQAEYKHNVYQDLDKLKLDNRFEKMTHTPNAFPPQSILLQMIFDIYITGKKIRDDIGTILTTLEKELDDTTAVVKNAMVANTSGAYKDIKEVAEKLYIPEFAWHMNPVFTGRIDFSPEITSPTIDAYSELQRLANIPPNGTNRYNVMGGAYKRQRITGGYNQEEISYEHFKGVPLDILTGYCDISGKATLDPTRPRIDLNATPGGISTVVQLRDAMAGLAATMSAGFHLIMPEQYKTTKQYEAQPLAFQQALAKIRPFRFTLVGTGPDSWKVERV